MLTVSKSGLFAFDYNEVYDGQRNGLSTLIDNLQIEDSLQEKAYCAFYSSGCYGICSWMIAVDNTSYYSVLFAETDETTHRNQYKTIQLHKDDERMRLLFSFLNTAYIYEQRATNKHFTPFCYYFMVCDNEHKIVFEWNQNTFLAKSEEKSPVEVFMPICISFVMPQLVF